MIARLTNWLDDRLGLRGIYDTVLDRKVPKVNWWFTLGSATLFLVTLQGLTGILLTVYYVPHPDQAYDSINYIMNEVAFGWLIRGIHHWGATLMVITVFLHLLRTFFYGAYKYPREMTWFSGVGLLMLVLGFGFTGYLLPWDQKAFWATTVGTRIAEVAPGIGNWILRIMRGGEELSALTLSRFHGTHVWVLPALLITLLGVHLYLVIRIGISSVPEPEE